ncbi:MAG: phosphodiester glycosidase family protein, partial [Bacteroidota bacterium]
LAPGVRHSFLTDPRGPWEMHVVSADLRSEGITLETVLAGDRLRARERVSSMAARREAAGLAVLAAVNGDYFNTATGEIQNNAVAGGTCAKAFLSPGTREGALDIPNSQFGITAGNRPVLGQMLFEGRVFWPRDGASPLAGVNILPRRGGIVLFNRYHPDPLPGGGEILVCPLRLIRQGGDTLFCLGGSARRGGTSARAGLILLAAYGGAADTLRARLKEGEPVSVLLSFRPSPGPLRELVGGWPRIVRDGRSIFRNQGFPEDPASAIFARRHPRTGIGFSRDSSTVFLITVDGRRKGSAGMSLPEFADLMVRLGVHQGLNLDGGGSTAMVIGRRVANAPSDPAGERAVGSAVLVVQRPTRTSPGRH